MGSFSYKAMNASGALIRGTIEAPSQAIAIQNLRSQGHFPLSAIDAEGAGLRALLARPLSLRKAGSSRALCAATQELSTLLDAGLELDRALGILLGLSELGALREQLASARNLVRDGATLADALARAPAFPRFYVSMVRAGEAGGALKETLGKLADYLKRAQALRETVASALVYPVILLVTAGLSITIILVFVLPQFEPLFAQAGQSLPLPTRIVMTIGNLLRDYWWALAVLIAGAGIWLKQALRQPEFRRRWDGLLLRLPLLGDLFRAINVERFARTLGTMIVNGVPLPTALALTKETLSNAVIAEAVKNAAASLREGESLAQQMAQAKVFPPLMLDLIGIGEQTGRLGEMLLRQADLDEMRIKQRVDRLVALLVPAMTIVLGLIVGGVIAAMLSAILGVNDLALQ